MALKPGHSKPYSGSRKPATGKWAGEGPEHGEIVNHPTIKGHFVLRHKGFKNSDSSNHQELNDQLAARKKMGWKSSAEEDKARWPDMAKPMKKFSEFLN